MTISRIFCGNSNPILASEFEHRQVGPGRLLSESSAIDLIDFPESCCIDYDAADRDTNLIPKKTDLRGQCESRFHVVL